MSFIDVIKARAKKDKKTIVLPETNDVRTIQAAVTIIEEDIADLILLGNKDKIVEKAESYGYDLTGATFVDPDNCDKLEEYIAILCECRKSKGI